MHEVAITTTIAAILFILSTCSLTKISDRGEINNNRASCIISSLQVPKGISGMLLLSELNVYITNHMVSKIVTDIQALNLTVFAQLFK